MLIINFAHPVTDAQRAQIEALTGRKVERIVDVLPQFDPARPFAEQTRAALDQTGLSAAEWQATPLLLNLPSFNVIAAVLLAELHGRAGYFPAVLRLRPIAGTTPTVYEAAEIINLQQIRDEARGRR